MLSQTFASLIVLYLKFNKASVTRTQKDIELFGYLHFCRISFLEDILRALVVSTENALIHTCIYLLLPSCHTFEIL